MLKTSNFFLTQSLKLKHKDLESRLSITSLFYSIALQCVTWKHMIIKTYKVKKLWTNFWKFPERL